MLDLNPLLRATSVAVVGASPKAGSFGWHVVRQLLDFGYPGRIVPVNPGYDFVEGLPCARSLGDLEHRVDCAAICLGDERLEMALTDAVAGGTRSAVIFGTAAGAAADGTPLQARLRSIAKSAGIPLMGANCMGFFNFTDRLFLTGYPYHRSPETGAISFITHSGSTLSAVAKNTRGMNFNYVISPGQELVATAADFLNFALEQPETRVVGLFLETVRDPEELLAGLTHANERDIPVVMLKVGRTEQGARMALAHTGAVAGSNAAIEAVADRYNVSLVRTIEELLDTLELMATGRRFTAPGFAAITDSGGERGMMVDLATDMGLPFAELSAETKDALRQHLDPGLEPANPADLWGSGRGWQAKFRAAIDAIIADPSVGAFNFGIDFNIGSRLGPDYHRLAVETFTAAEMPVAVIGNVAAGMNPDEAAALRAEGVPVLAGTETGLMAFKHLRSYSLRSGRYKPLAAPGVSRFPAVHLRSLEAAEALTEWESYEFLRDLGVPHISSLAARTLGEATAAADALGYPVVLKSMRPGLMHKSGSGGVVLDLATEAALVKAYQAMCQRLGPAVLVQPHVRLDDCVELLVGMTVDAQFGPLVTVGLGGVWIEALRDAVTFLAPCTADEVNRRLPLLRGSSLLAGLRGRTAVDVPALATLVERFSLGAAALRGHVAEIDINPLVARGSEFLALDALVVLASAGGWGDAASRD